MKEYPVIGLVFSLFQTIEFRPAPFTTEMPFAIKYSPRTYYYSIPERQWYINAVRYEQRQGSKHVWEKTGSAFVPKKARATVLIYPHG